MSEEHARSLATIGLVGLVLAVTANGQPQSVGRLSLDTIIAGVPLAIALCLPYVWRKGVDTVPRYLMGPAALFFLVWGLASVAANGGALSSLLTMARYASYFLLAIVVSVVAQDALVRRLLLWTITVTAALTAVLAYLQFLDPQFTPGMNGISAEITTRVVGTFYNSNFYAEYLLLVLGIVLGSRLHREACRAHHRRRDRRDRAWGASADLHARELGRSRSRGARVRRDCRHSLPRDGGHGRWRHAARAGSDGTAQAVEFECGFRELPPGHLEDRGRGDATQPDLRLRRPATS